MTQVSLCLFSFLELTNLKLNNISIFARMVKKVMMDLDSLQASGPDCISVVVLKNRGLELSYLYWLNSSICALRKSLVFQIVRKFHLWSLYLRMLGERSTAKNYHLVSLLSVVSKVFEKLVNKKIVAHLEKSGLFL